MGTSEGDLKHQKETSTLIKDGLLQQVSQLKVYRDDK